MKRAKHAPGPWEVLDGKLIHARGYLVAKLLGERQHGEANARLIAAAPELLAALELIMRENQGAMFLNGTDGEMYSEWYVAREAIKKAKGEL